MNPEPVVAFDVGGTKTLIALIDHEGKILFKEKHPTPKESSDRLGKFITERALGFLDSHGVEKDSVLGVGIGVAGTIDTKKGEVITSPHLPLAGTPLKQMIQDASGLPVYVDNDATLAALGESRFGAASGVRNMVMLTIGTGIGGGIIINGEVYRGATGGAGEIGHMIIDLNGPLDDCGVRGCLEVLAAGDAIGAAAGNKTGEEVYEAARNGDKQAVEILTKIGGFLGAGLVNLVNIFDPEMIVLGGGVMLTDEIMREEATRIVKKTALRPNRDDVRIVVSDLGENATLLGAAALVFEGG